MTAAAALNVDFTYSAGVRTYSVRCSDCGRVRGICLTRKDAEAKVASHKREHLSSTAGAGMNVPLAAAPAAVAHRIRWYVYAGETLIPRESTMRGSWPCEAKCSCGWETRTGGAVRSFIEREVADHKFDVEYGFWQAS